MQIHSESTGSNILNKAYPKNITGALTWESYIRTNFSFSAKTFLNFWCIAIVDFRQ